MRRKNFCANSLKRTVQENKPETKCVQTFSSLQSLVLRRAKANQDGSVLVSTSPVSMVVFLNVALMPVDLKTTTGFGGDDDSNSGTGGEFGEADSLDDGKAFDRDESFDKELEGLGSSGILIVAVAALVM